MISDEQLNAYRINGTVLRVIRDAEPQNDVKGIVMAWNEDTVMIRKMNRRMLNLSKTYHYQPWDEERTTFEL